MGQQLVQRILQSLNQGIDRLGREHGLAVGQLQLQTPAQDATIDHQPVAQRGILRLAMTCRFTGRAQHRIAIELLVELPQVVEGDTRLPRCTQHQTVLAQVAQHAIADAGSRHTTDAFLNRTQCLTRFAGRAQAQRVKAGEPANGARQLQRFAVIEGVTAMALHFQQGLLAPRPVAQGATDSRQQDVIDAQALSGQDRTKKFGGGIAVQSNVALPSLAPGGRRVAIGLGNRRGIGQLRQPVRHFGVQCRTRRQRLLAGSPDGMRVAFGRQYSWLPRANSTIGGVQIFQQHPPGDAIHR